MVDYNKHEAVRQSTRVAEENRVFMATKKAVHQKMKQTKLKQAMVCFAMVILITLIPLTTLLAQSNLITPTPDEPSYNFSFLNMPLNADSATIVEMNHGIRLYEKQAEVAQSMPLVNHLMTAVLALEYLDERTIITLSQDAANLADDLSTFSAGGRYPVSYLLFALLLDDSNAAAYALAEEISGSHLNFVNTMNNRAAAIGMSSTWFTNATGQYDQEQYTNSNDLMTLLRYALRNNDFLDYFGQRDNMFTLPDGSLHYFSNDFASAWSFSDNTVEGAALSAYDNRYTAALLLTDEVKNIRYAVIMTGPYTESSFTNNRQLIGDLQSISSRISAAYETSVLAARGQVYQTNYVIAGQSVNLVFNETVSYTHPLGNSLQESINTVLMTEEMTLPLSTQDIIGHVEFHLSEGSVIRVNLSSDTVILARNDTLNYVLSIINANWELVVFILFLISILLLIILMRLGRVTIRFVYQMWLNRQRRGFAPEPGLQQLASEGDGMTGRSLESALSHRLRSKPNTVPARIARRYRKLKQISDSSEDSE